MTTFFATLKERNPLFFYLGSGFLLLFSFFLVVFAFCHYETARICHYAKPFKFSLSFGLYLFTLGWFMEYLKEVWSPSKIKQVSLLLAILVMLEMGIILIQSLISFRTMTLYHFANGIIVLNTMLLAYIAFQFFRKLTLTPKNYLTAIRGSFVIFILSSLIGIYLVQKYGFVPPDEHHFGMPFSEFSSPRQNLISLHFIGLHYIQILPLGSYYLDLGKWFSYLASGLYIGITLFVTF